MWKVWIYIAPLLMIAVFGVFSESTDLPEFCQMEEFKASCPIAHVLVVTRAEYGRMKIGRCVKERYGKMPCSADVLDRVDRYCSGRQSCDFFVGKLHGTQPCALELAAYLQVEYHCQKVETAVHATCLPGSVIRATLPSGYLANSVTMESRKGSEQCPWVIQAESGQRINVTLINFARIGEDVDAAGTGGGGGGAGADGGTDMALGSRPRICYQYVTLKEGDYVRTITECEGAPREGLVYSSNSHTLQIEMLTRKSSEVYFLLKYQVFGCADLPPQVGTWTKRVNDHVTVTCNATGEKWLLSCGKSGKWEGKTGNCTPPDSSTSWNLSMLDKPLSSSFPYGILVVVAVGVALGVFLGGILLICASRYYKRQRQRTMTADPRYHPAAYVLDESKLEPYTTTTGHGQQQQQPQQTTACTPEFDHHSNASTCKYTDSVKKIPSSYPQQQQYHVAQGQQQGQQQQRFVPYGPYGTLPPGYHHPGQAHIYESPGQQGHRDSV